MPGGVANLLDNHASQILDKNQDDLNFSINLRRTIARKQALIMSTLLCCSRVTSCDFPKRGACLQVKRTTTFLNQFTLHYPVHKHLLFTLLH